MKVSDLLIDDNKAGFSKGNISKMRKRYLAYPILQTLSTELGMYYALQNNTNQVFAGTRPWPQVRKRI